MKPTGGYFELETSPGKEYHPNLIRLNTGRNCLEYILRIGKYSKVYIPYYTCDVILEPFKKLDINYSFYHIDQQFEPIIDFEMHKDEALLYTNYFGLKGQTVERLAGKNLNLIIDNAQAFFDRPLKGIDTFYSPRKFFGLPDGGYLATTIELKDKLETDRSVDRFSHLLKRIEFGPEEGYQDFLDNDSSLIDQPIKRMSALTNKLLSSIDYKTIAAKRRKNFELLHSQLMKHNEIDINLHPGAVPMVYPFYSSKPGLREYLIQNKIYVATYWSNILDWTKREQWENKLAQNLIPLPIDQRYGNPDMFKIIELIERFD